MRYARFDVDVMRPLPDLPLPPDHDGLAVLVRRKDVPIGFWIEERRGRTSIPAGTLATVIAADMGARIIAEAVREELDATLPAGRPALTIAICTKDRPADVERLLQSLHAHGAGPSSADPVLDILIVDNAPSDDATLMLARRWPLVRYVRESRQGLNFARNRALQEARGELLAYLDDDVTVDRGWLAGLCRAWADNPDAASFTGQVLPMELASEAQILFERRGGFRRGFERVRYGPVLPGDPLYPGGAGNFGAGANMAFSTAALRSLGGFDEALDTGALVPGGGDLDMFYRVIRAGRALVYEPRFLVYHQHRRDMDALGRQYRRSWGLGFMCYLVKCLKTDRERRVNLLRLLIWWFNNNVSGLLTHVRRRRSGEPHIPPSMLAGELWGGVVGLLGGYGRSRRRVERIRRACA